MTQNKQLATIEKNAADFLGNLKNTLPTYAIRPYKNETFVRSAMIAIVSNEDLQSCLTTDQGKASIVNAMRMAAGTGLSLNPQEGKAALIPYSKNIGTQQNKKWIKTAQYQVMKNGLIELALESGKVEFITADTVRANDEFTLSKTMNGDEYFFSPARTDRGEIDGFFAAVKMKDGTCHTVYMATDQAKEHREHFSKKTAMPEEGYGQKTVLKRLLNNLHISRELSQAVGSDDVQEAELLDYPEEQGTSADDLNAALTDKVETANVVEGEDDAPEPSSEKEQKNKDSVI
jgi:phage RecT family recombinase